MKYEPHPYQMRAIKFAVGQACAGLLLDMGLGKSSIMLSVAKALLAKGFVQRVLVIAPLRVAHITWPDEARKWDDFRDLKVVVLHGKDKDKLLNAPHHIGVINPEGLRWLVQATKGKPPYDMLIVDESTQFKNARTLRFQTLRPLLPRFRRRYILTGEPSPNGLIDLFGQIYILDEGEALGRYITHYRNAHFYNPDQQGWEWLVRPGEEQKIYAKLAPLTLRMAAEDYLKMPPLIENDVFVDLPRDARLLYSQMEASMFALLDRGTLTAANAGVLTGKCRQIASGGVYDDAHKREMIHTAKLDALDEIIESAQGKSVLVAYEFDHEREAILQRYPDAPWIGGGVSSTEFRRIEQEWNAGRVPVLLAQPKSVAHGLNLQAGGHRAVWYTPTFNRGDYAQFNARLHRQGQKHPVFVDRIIARDTVDEAVIKSLTAKGTAQKALLDALKTYREG